MHVQGVAVAQDGHALVSNHTNGERFYVALPETFDVISYLQKFVKFVDVGVAEDEGHPGWANMLAIALELGMLLVMARALFSMGGGGAGSSWASAFRGSVGVRSDADSAERTTFEDVAGAENAKVDLQEVVDFLKSPDKYAAVGAKVPKGVLLYGNPGTGKTLLAKAVAGEAGVPFISCSGSDFMEMFVGVGSSRMRSLFAQARSAAPCIIFIDEIDTIGKKRGTGAVHGNDERDQTINQLLTLMCGFESNEGVIVMAATNRLDILDEALLRPGRFDRKIHVELPSRHGRERILHIHTRDKPLAEDVVLAELASITAGFSGADLQNLANEAAIYAARASSDCLRKAHFEAALEKVTLGETRQNVLLTEQKRRVLAVHEAGHTLMALLLESDFDLVRKVSIIPRGASGGATYFEAAEDRVDIALMSRTYYENRVMVALGGRAAEELVFSWDEVTTGAAGDISEVHRLCHQMVTQLGFSRRVGPVQWTDYAQHRDVQEEVRQLVAGLYERTLQLLTTNKKYLDAITQALLEKETLDRADILACVACVDSESDQAPSYTPSD